MTSFLLRKKFLLWLNYKSPIIRMMHNSFNYDIIVIGIKK